MLKTIHTQSVENSNMPHLHTILLRGDGHVVSDLEIHASHEGERDKQKNLIGGGGVEFITRAGKRFFVQYNEFSFIVNPSAATLAAA